MRSSVLVALLVSAGLTLAACGSSGGKTSSSTTPTTNAKQLSSPTWEKAGPNPSQSAKMICQKEAATEIASAVLVKQERVTAPKWVRARHILSCSYIYPRGKVTLAVKEMSSEAETTAYFERLKKTYGTVQQLSGIGQDAWLLKNNDLVARKDYKVLLVDVTGVPADFAKGMTRSDLAVNYGVVIMTCWTGS